MKKLAIFISKYTIGNSPSLLNLIEYLDKIYSVTIFLDTVWLIPADLPNKAKHIVYVRRRHHIYYKLNEKLFVIKRKFDVYIAVDPHGFFLCKRLFPRSIPFYYSLELYIKNEYFGLDYSDEICSFERENIHNIKGLIIQSEERGSIFKKDYGLPDNFPTFYLPVTYRGHSVSEKNNYVREKYNLPKGCKIALHLGGIAGWHSCIELAAEFSKLDNWVLFFQGYADITYLPKMRAYIKENNIDNVFISDEIFENIDEIDKILKSCDIGIAWYNDISIGFTTAAKSSGKISAYLKYGLPVISNNYSGFIETIEKNNIGVCIETIGQLSSAIKKISENYDYYSVNVLKEYDTNFCFENYEKLLFNFIDDTAPKNVG